MCTCARVTVCLGHHLEVSFHFLPCLRQGLIHGVLSLAPTLLFRFSLLEISIILEVFSLIRKISITFYMFTV